MGLLNFSLLALVLSTLFALANTYPAPLQHQAEKSINVSGPIVAVKNGTIEGLVSETYGQDFFLGIPFATSPVGDLRFRIPQSLNNAFNTTHKATAYAPECIGYGGDDIGYPESEDCLYLNVIRPSGITADADLPVAVWIHGGGLVMGGTRDLRYNLSFIVANSVEIGQPMIGISIAYRLSAWGFLGGKQALEGGATNLGFRDQRLALQWLNENIGAFGGSKDKVTIWGESAGGQSVGAHILAYGGRDDGLFHAAIAESGGPGVVFDYAAGPWFNSTSQQVAYDMLLNSTSCNDLDCLRALPFDNLNAAINVTVVDSANGNITLNGLGPFGPAMDGDFIQDFPSTQLSRGAFVKVPLLIGCNSDEGTAFGVGGINTDADFAAAVAQGGPDDEAVAIIAALYPNIPAIGIPSEATFSGSENSSFNGAQWKRSAAYYGDAVVIGPRRASNHAWANFNVSSFSYRFDVLAAGVPNYVGATHFQEVAFVFDNTQGLGYAESELESEPESFFTLATQISRSWVGFVTELDPNKNGLEGVNVWPEYVLDGGVGKNFVFTVEGGGNGSFAEADDFRADGIAFITANAKSQFGR